MPREVGLDGPVLVFGLGVSVLPALVFGLAPAWQTTRSGLAAVGLYGLAATSVSQRTREFGVRMALGAAGGDILRLVVRQGPRLALIGAALGLLAALMASRVLETLLFDLAATDPSTYLGVVLLLAAVALAASLVPAIRATRIDPLRVLRYE